MPYLFFFALLGLGFAPAVRAHPHVWLDLDLALVTEKNSLTALNIVWTWDEVYSTHFRKTYDENRNGQFEPAEATELRRQEIASFAAFSEFVFVRLDDERIPVGPPKSLVIDLKGDQMRFQFQVPLSKPIPLAGIGHAHRLTVGSYDPEYYIESVLPEDGSSPRFAPPLAECSIRIVEDRKHPIYFGFVYPQIGAVTCAG